MPPHNSDDLSTLERMRRRLYTPGTANQPLVDGVRPVATPATPSPDTPPQAWQTPDAPPPVAPKRGLSWPVLFLIGAAVFFIIAAAIAVYFLVFGARAVSTENIDLRVEGPAAIGSGQVVTLLLSLENRNPVPVSDTLLTIEFPATTRSAEDSTTPYTRYEETLGTIESGSVGHRSVRAVLFGGEGETLRIPVRFEYHIEGSAATYVKEGSYEVEVTSSPLSIRASALSEATPNQPITFGVTVRSHATEPLDDVVMLLERPFPAGFSLERGAGPLFALGTLAPGEERTIQVRGTLTGDDAGERVFRFSAGVGQSPDSLSIATSFATSEVALLLTNAFLRPTLTFGQEGATPTSIGAGNLNQVTVGWVNSLTTGILDGEVSVALSGSGLDTGSIAAYDGFFRSRDTTVVFAKDLNAELARLDPGAQGSGSFSYAAKTTSALIGTRNPEVTMTVSVAGRRVGENNVLERIDRVITRTIPVRTELALTARGLHGTGAFANRGPLPPVADQETTYTIELSLANSVNTVADAVVSGTLPQYVSFAGATNPNDGSIRYDAATRTVTWRAGELAPGVGHQGAPRTASFQVILLPSASQRGTSPVLFSSIRTTGVDRFTRDTLERTAPAITTRIDTDPSFSPGDDLVR